MMIEPSRPARSALRFNRWQLTVLLVPIFRALLYLVGLSPSPLSESVLPKAIQVVALSTIGLVAMIAAAGVVMQVVLVERAGLRALMVMGPLFGLVLLYSDWRKGLLWALIYSLISFCAFMRQHEITKALVITPRVLEAE